VIVRDGIYRMYEQQEDIFYYLTVYNENYSMPAMPQAKGDADSINAQIEMGILRGAYCYRRSEEKTGQVINLLSSGSIMQQALSAKLQLQALGYRVNVWSVTSYNELYRDAVATDRWNRLHPEDPSKQCYLEKLFSEEEGVFVSASDYMSSLGNSIARWMPKAYTVLGTDGYGLSEAREDLRDYFEISDKFIVQAALQSLYQQGAITSELLQQQLAPLGINADKIDPASI